LNGAILLDGSLLDMARVGFHIFDGPLAGSVRDLHNIPSLPKMSVPAEGVLGVVLEEGLVFQSDQLIKRRLTHNWVWKIRIP